MKHLLRRTFLVAVGIAVAWGLLRYVWIEFDFLPQVQNTVIDFGIPMVLGILGTFLIRHDISSLKDKYENFAWIVSMLMFFMIFINVNRFVQHRTARVISLTELTSSNISQTDHADYVEVNTSMQIPRWWDEISITAYCLSHVAALILPFIFISFALCVVSVVLL